MSQSHSYRIEKGVLCAEDLTAVGNILGLSMADSLSFRLPAAQGLALALETFPLVSPFTHDRSSASTRERASQRRCGS